MFTHTSRQAPSAREAGMQIECVWCKGSGRMRAEQSPADFRCVACEGTGREEAAAPSAEFVMVPREPTEAMVRAALDCQDADPEDSSETEFYFAYKAALAAAPASPVMAAGVTDYVENAARELVNVFQHDSWEQEHEDTRNAYRKIARAALSPLLAQLSGLSGEVERLRVMEEAEVTMREAAESERDALRSENEGLRAENAIAREQWEAALAEAREWNRKLLAAEAKLEAAEGLLREARDYVALEVQKEAKMNEALRIKHTTEAKFLARIDAALSAHSGGTK